MPKIIPHTPLGEVPPLSSKNRDHSGMRSPHLEIGDHWPVGDMWTSVMNFLRTSHSCSSNTMTSTPTANRKYIGFPESERGRYHLHRWGFRQRDFLKSPGIKQNNLGNFSRGFKKSQLTEVLPIVTPLPQIELTRANFIWDRVTSDRWNRSTMWDE